MLTCLVNMSLTFPSREAGDTRGQEKQEEQEEGEVAAAPTWTATVRRRTAAVHTPKSLVAGNGRGAEREPEVLKILAPALASDSAFRSRFIAGSRAAAAVDDPYIIPVYEAGEAEARKG